MNDNEHISIHRTTVMHNTTHIATQLLTHIGTQRQALLPAALCAATSAIHLNIELPPLSSPPPYRILTPSHYIR